MIGLICFASVAVLAILSVTRYRSVVIAGFYCLYALLTILGEFAAPHLGPVTVYRALYVILGISILARWIQDPTFATQVRRWPVWPYISLIVLVFASSLYSISKESISWDSDWNLWPHVVVMLLFLAAACLIHRPIDLEIFSAATVMISVFLSVWVIWNAAQLNFEAFRGGISSDQNYVSMFVFLGMLSLINVVLTGQNRWRFLFVPVLLCGVFASFILASRGGFVAFGAATLWLLAGHLRHRGRWVIVSTVAVLVVLAGTALLLPGGNGLLNSFQDENIGTLDFRLFIWKGSFVYFVNSGLLRMLFGQGLGSSTLVIGPVMPDLLNYHNEYLRWLMDQGIVGLAAVLFFFFTIGRKVLTMEYRLKYLMMAWLIFLMIMGLSETLCDGHLLWLILGVLASGSSLAVGRDVSRQPAGVVPLGNRPPVLGTF